MNRLSDKVAVITGGACGIGRATALRFAMEGAQVVIWDISIEGGRKLLDHLESNGLTASFTQVDIADLSAVRNAAASVMETYGKIDILINNAGIVRDASLLKMTEVQFQQVIDVNLKGTFHCTQTIAPYMVQNGYGRIIQSTSIVAANGNFGQTNYVASKAGITGMTKVWARELGRKGITVNAVAPGFISTDMVATIPENVMLAMKDKVPVGRMGTAEEVASAFLFLASDEAGFINGAVLNVDGGAII